MHCMQRLHAAKLRFTDDDIQKLSAHTFSVKGKSIQQDSNERNLYKVFLGSDSQFPNCECADFKKHCLQCKHIFSILEIVPGYSWDSLPAFFTNNPLFVLDQSVFSSEQKQDLVYSVKENDQREIVVSENPVFEIQEGMEDTSLSPPSTILNATTEGTGDVQLLSSIKNVTEGTTEDVDIHLPSICSLNSEEKGIDPLAVSLRSKLQFLQDFSYLCKDESSLATINDSIGSAVSTANSLLKREGGLVLQPTPEKRRKVDSSKLRCLPSRKRKKKLSLFERYKNRVGKFADTVKASSHISVLSDHEAKVKHLKLVKSKKTIVKKYKKMQKDKAEKKKEAAEKCKEETTKEEDIQIVGIYMRSTVDPYKRRVMKEHDFQVILSSSWLNDTIVNTAQNCLRDQFQTPGLYDTSLGPYLNYPKTQVFYQILHDSNHWILVSTYDTSHPAVKLYDSDFHGKISPKVQKQTASILRTQVDKIIFSVQPVQQQTNSNDCGVFAVAFLVELLFGGDPTTVLFDIGKMRSHLLTCLKSQQFDNPFPKVEGKHEHSFPNNPLIEIPVYCVCRMPYFKEDDEFRELQMAECDRCHQWYHRSCTTVPDYVFKQKNKFWVCSKC